MLLRFAARRRPRAGPAVRPEVAVSAAPTAMQHLITADQSPVCGPALVLHAPIDDTAALQQAPDTFSSIIHMCTLPIKNCDVSR
jgi:hypothetical protein